ncbi:hypothetical protein ACFQ02_08965 [Seminibacterium arietis]|uniref:Lipoprotein n=1 Tax=Seminibacterium arietis TaxID=1173502 RepID=A0ABW3IBL4_9PAST
MKVYGYFIRIILLSSLFCSFFVTPVYGESRSEAVYTEFSDQDLVSLLENHNKKKSPKEARFEEVRILSEGTIFVRSKFIPAFLNNNTKKDKTLDLFLPLPLSNNYPNLTYKDVLQLNNAYSLKAALVENGSEKKIVFRFSLSTASGITKDYVIDSVFNFLFESGLFLLELDKLKK